MRTRTSSLMSLCFFSMSPCTLADLRWKSFCARISFKFCGMASCSSSSSVFTTRWRCLQANRAFRSCTRDFWGCMHQLLLFSSVDLSFVLETLRREALADGDESQVFLRSVASSTCRGFVSRRHLLDLFCVVFFCWARDQEEAACWTSICSGRTKVMIHKRFGSRKSGAVRVWSSWTKWLQRTRNGGNVSAGLSPLPSLLFVQ